MSFAAVALGIASLPHLRAASRNQRMSSTLMTITCILPDASAEADAVGTTHAVYGGGATEKVRLPCGPVRGRKMPGRYSLWGRLCLDYTLFAECMLMLTSGR